MRISFFSQDLPIAMDASVNFSHSDVLLKHVINKSANEIYNQQVVEHIFKMPRAATSVYNIVSGATRSSPRFLSHHTCMCTLRVHTKGISTYVPLRFSRDIHQSCTHALKDWEKSMMGAHRL